MVRLLLARQGDASLLARNSVDVNMTAQNGFTALYMASQNGHVEVVRRLLARKGVDMSSRVSCASTKKMTGRPSNPHRRHRALNVLPHARPEYRQKVRSPTPRAGCAIVAVVVVLYYKGIKTASGVAKTSAAETAASGVLG